MFAKFCILFIFLQCIPWQTLYVSWILVSVDFVGASNSPDNNRTQFSLLLLPTSHINSVQCFPLVFKDSSLVMSPLAFVEACSCYVSQPGLSHGPPSAFQELEFRMHDTMPG